MQRSLIRKGAQNLTLTCEAGSYALIGTDATLTAQYNYSLACETGSYSPQGLMPIWFYCGITFSLVGRPHYAQPGTNARLTSSHDGTRIRFYMRLDWHETPTSTARWLWRVRLAVMLSLARMQRSMPTTYSLSVGSYVLVGTSVGLFILSPTPGLQNVHD